MESVVLALGDGVLRSKLNAAIDTVLDACANNDHLVEVNEPDDPLGRVQALRDLGFAVAIWTPDHAQEQAENAYPAATVLSVLEVDLEAGATGAN